MRGAAWVSVWVVVGACAPRGEPPRASHSTPLASALTEPRGLAVAGARALGAALFHGRAGCAACHRIGAEGHAEVGPNLGVGPGFPEPLAHRARAGGDVFAYVVHSIVDPDELVVPGYPAGKMPRVEEPPLSLSDAQVAALAAFVAGVTRPAGAPGVGAELGDARLADGPAMIAAVRASRSQRVAAAHLRELEAHANLDAARADNGPHVYVAHGCAGCHGPPERTPLKDAARRDPARTTPAPPGPRTAVLTWLAQVLPRHPTCAELARASELADLVAWLAAP